MLDVAADASDAEWVKTEANDQWMGMTDDEAGFTKSEDDEGIEPDESVVDSRADSNAGFTEILDPVQADLNRRIAMQRASLKRRVKHIEEMRLKLQRCVLVGGASFTCCYGQPCLATCGIQMVNDLDLLNFAQCAVFVMVLGQSNCQVYRKERM